MNLYPLLLLPSPPLPLPSDTESDYMRYGTPLDLGLPSDPLTLTLVPSLTSYSPPPLPLLYPPLLLPYPHRE